jgi:hypothetical protein
VTLRKRLDRLEGATAKPASGPCAIVREIMQPSATGPELVALMLRALDGGGVVHIDHNPGEDKTGFRARFAAKCPA